MAQIDQKIGRLMTALAEGSELTMPYINRTIEKLERQRQKLLERQALQHGCLKRKLDPLKFGLLGFEQKKLGAAQFIQETRLSGEPAEMIWNI